MTDRPSHLLDLAPCELEGALIPWLEGHDEPPYRAEQILQHLLVERLSDPHRMTSLPLSLRQALAAGPLAPAVKIDQVQESRDGTRKYRFRLADDLHIESVWIPSGRRGTLCLSSQVGCAAACTFCATGTLRLSRNLAASEIVGQWLAVATETAGVAGPGVTQLVFMGMGEPLHNYPALAAALALITDSEGFRFSPRRITVSTVGIPDRMEQLVREFPQVRLALSLHSARDETRGLIVPINGRHPVAELRKTIARIADGSRRISLEYVLLRAINDSPQEAEALAHFAQESGAHINLLPFHPFPGAPYPPSTGAEMAQFRQRVLAHFDGSVTIRRSRGLDIDGACGQLALRPSSFVPSAPLGDE